MKTRLSADDGTRQAKQPAGQARPGRTQADAGFVDARPESAVLQRLQGVVENSPQVAQLQSMQAMANASPVTRANHTGLPDRLKAGIESLSGASMDHVKVHYNSDQPAQLQAHAYARGSEIHLAPGQERHLPHEAWHIVQQAQGRVRPTMQMKGTTAVNDDAGLEREADVMGARAMQMRTRETPPPASAPAAGGAAVAQCVKVAHPENGRWRNLSNEEARDIEQRHELTALDAIAKTSGYIFFQSDKVDGKALKSMLETLNYQNRSLIESWNPESYLVHDTKNTWRVPTEAELKGGPESKVAKGALDSLDLVAAKGNKEFYSVGPGFLQADREKLMERIAPQKPAIAGLLANLAKGVICIFRDEKGAWGELTKEEAERIRKRKSARLVKLEQIEGKQTEWFYIDTDDLSTEEQDALVERVRTANSVVEKDTFAQTLKARLEDTGMTVVKQNDGTWREVRDKENVTLYAGKLDALKSAKKPLKIDTASLERKEKEKLIEMIAKDGSGEFARQVRARIGSNIYTDAGVLAKDVALFFQKLDRLKSGLPLDQLEALLPTLAADLQDIDDDKNKKKIINAARVEGIYRIFNDLPFKILYARTVLGRIDAMRDQWDTRENREANSLLRFSFDQAEVFRPEHQESIIQAARTVREDTAYAKLSKGTQWAKEELKNRVEATSKTPDSALIPALSARNLAMLKKEMQPILHQDSGMQALYERLMEVPYTISHATSAFNAIRNSGMLSSLDNLGLWGNAQNASGMSSENNLSYKEDGDFAFFRFGVGSEPMQTRYGPTTIVANADLLQEKSGWVSLHDQLVPLDRPAMRELKDKRGTTVRTSAHDEEHTSTGKQTRWHNHYPNTGQKHEINFLDEVFYGKDIKAGIALSMLREIDRIGGQFKQDALHTKGTADLGKLLISLYRVEAKLPSSFKLHEAKDTVVHNAVGDGRYYESGIIHPEGMAASAAYANCQRQRTLCDSFIAGYTTVSKAYAISKSVVGFHKQIDAAHKAASNLEELRRLLTEAETQAQIFVNAVLSKDMVHETDEAKRLLIAASKALDERREETARVQKEKQGYQRQEEELQLELRSLEKTLPPSFAADPAFEKRAETFEQRLGAYAFRHGLATGAAERLASKAAAYMDKRGKLIDEVKALAKDLETHDAAWAKIGDTNKGLAGTVGTEIAHVQEALKSGNTRMRMQHVYQFMNRVLGRDIQVDATWDKLSALIHEATLNKELLTQQRQRLKTGGTHDSLLSEANEKNLVLKQRERIRYRIGDGENTRPAKDIDTPLHDLEKTHMGIQKDEDIVSWHEGAKSWLIDESHAWSQTMRQMSVPLMAGPSGHTNAFMQAAQFLGVDEPYNVRLAVIGHLIPIRAHSLVEIMVAAKPYGADFTPSPKMYRSIAPLAEAELRDNVAVDRRFPDEGDSK